MAAPAWQATGTPQGALGGTNLTVAWPTHIANDVGVFYVQNNNQDHGFVAAQDAGFGSNLIVSTSAGAGGSNNSQFTAAFWCRATSSAMASPQYQNPLDTANNSYCLAFIVTYRGCITSGSPIDATNSNSDTSANTSYTINGVTMTGANRLIALVCAGTRDNATSSCSNDFTNATIGAIGNYANCATAGGNGGNINVGHGTMAAAGATGNTTGTFTAGTSQTKGMLAFALLPPVPISLHHPGHSTWRGVWPGVAPRMRESRRATSYPTYRRRPGSAIYLAA